MSIACLAGNHSVYPRAIPNQGFEFTRCTRCGRDLLRAGRGWRDAPPGFRIVWRGGTRRGAESGQLAFDLARPGHPSAVPVPPPPRRRRRRWRTAADLAGSALRLAASEAAEAVRAWLRRANAEPRPQPILRLTAD